VGAAAALGGPDRAASLARDSAATSFMTERASSGFG
jgi:hypothetical protein